MANIIKTKFELADAVKNKGLLFLNGDNDIIMANLPDQKYYTYGLNNNNDFYAFDVSTSHKGTTFSIGYKENGEEKTLENLNSQLIGYHNVVNLVGAVAFSMCMGVEHEAIRHALKKIVSPPHRLQLIRNNDVIIIDDAYNSNPSGSKAALDVLALFDGHKILITPGMVELGSEQENLNHAFGAQAAAVCDHVYLVGENQTKPILHGLISAGFDESRIFIVNHVKEAINAAYALKTERQKVLLLENDLPDNYA
jgi:UDP-N-acetylmuramoyl-tripeptide--D-alanyl-D-alanine ligase